MAACIWEKLKYHLGFWGAIGVLGLIVAGIAAIGLTPGGPGVAAFFTALVQTSMGAAGLTVAAVGGNGLIMTLVTGIILCWEA